VEVNLEVVLGVGGGLEAVGVDGTAEVRCLGAMSLDR